jgi:hypothetical protein
MLTPPCGVAAFIVNCCKLRAPHRGTSLGPFVTRAQRTRVQLYPQHWLLCHLGLYKFEFEFEFTGARPSVRLCVGPELARCVHTQFSFITCTYSESGG